MAKRGFAGMDYSDFKRLQKFRFSEATESVVTPDKMGQALRRKISSLEDLCEEFPVEPWVILLRMHFRPVHALRVSPYTTDTRRTQRGFGDELWQVGKEQMIREEAICFAEALRTSKTPPKWGTLDKRFGSSFLH